MVKEGSQNKEELGVNSGRPGHISRGWSQEGATPCGDLDHPWPGEKEERTLRGLSQQALVVSLLSSKQITGGLGRVLAAPSGPGAHRCAPKNTREPLPRPRQAHPHSRSGEMGLEKGSQSLGDPKTSVHTAGTGPELPGEHRHRSHLPLPHTGTLCPHRVWQRWKCRVGGGTSSGPQTHRPA